MKRLLVSLLFVSCSNGGGTNPLPVPHGYTTIEAPGGLKYHTGLLHPQEIEAFKGFGESHVQLNDCENLPDDFDLRDLGLVPEIRNQGNCGSCGMFSKTGSLESALLGQGIKLDLSEQEMVSCDRDQWGCEGSILGGFKYQINHGQGLEADFPYTSGRTGSNGACKSVPSAAKGVSFQYVGTSSRGPTEKELKCALVRYKTIPWITVGATNGWGNPPKSEKTPYTSCGRAQTNHAIGTVGYWKDKVSGKTYFIAKNSWGTSWGDHGYMSLPLGCNNFGEEVAFIEVDKLVPPSPSPVPPTPSPVPPSPTPGPPSPTPQPSPGPCQPPRTKMAAEVQVFPDTEVMLGVKSEAGVSYVWTDVVNVVMGKESMLYVTPVKDTVYKLMASNSCAVSESKVRVRLVQSLKN